MNKEQALSLIFEWQNIIRSTKGIQRELESDVMGAMGSKPIKIITGFRRSGKSFLARQIAARLLDEGAYTIENVLYLNFEDYRLSEVTNPEGLNRAYETFKAGSAKKGKKLLIFDEIQNVARWDKFIRTVYEKEDAELIITGSNSELLSAELGSNLAGRYIEFFLFPFSYREFLAYRGASVRSRADYYRRRDELNALFTEYLAYGGLPEVFDISSKDARLSYISGVLNKVILDDIVKRFKVENIDVLEKLLHYLLAGSGAITSYASLGSRLKALDVRIKPATVISYCGYFLKVFALFELNKFSWKQNRIFGTSKKFYAIDTGLLSLYRPLAENYSLRLENLALLELKRRHREVCYGANEAGGEIDFLARNDERSWDKYQVSVALTGGNEKRELGAFVFSDKHLKKGANYLLTLDEDEGELEYKGVALKKRSLIPWLLRLP